ncbi:hypothetical protein FGO68_gene13431 [Halteria grandinella]|uniref:Uncharacterized protein n=1 Tax=Halteria grandinella TaxID=5974 RepID=A0A8J8NCB0_HALGN|nr:hypothetical protein FGO68_gene13431 [Halteria grandinella]
MNSVNIRGGKLLSSFAKKTPLKKQDSGKFFEEEVKDNCECAGDSERAIQSCCNKQPHKITGEQEDIEMMSHEQMAANSSSYKSAQLHDDPAQDLNEIQRALLTAPKRKIQAVFSKLPCIKTCMSKFQVSSGEQQQSRKIAFERVDDDFGIQANNQISSADCRHTCDAQKICPEILPGNCDDYFNKKCTCTVYCKKTLKYLQPFVKDAKQYAEIEDLCKVIDQTEEVEVLSGSHHQHSNSNRECM